MSDKNTPEDDATLESVARSASQNESRKIADDAGYEHKRPSLKSIATQAMTPSLRRGLVDRLEPETLAREPQRKSSVEVDVDDL
jgi:hypothetical protein